MIEGELAQYIDHTLLKPETTPGQIANLCREAGTWGVAAVCVPPSYVGDASRHLQGSAVHVGTVVGFPFGYAATSVKRCEAEKAQEDGADEIDMVMHIGRFKAGDYPFVEEDLTAIIKATPGILHKVIIETALLDAAEKRTALSLVLSSGAEFVKTSTGVVCGGATVEDVRLLKGGAGDRLGVKASGGIRNLEAALALIEAGAARIGTSAAASFLSDWSARRQR